jgi:hypothetical protein
MRYRQVGDAIADLTRRVGEGEWADLLEQNPRAGNPHKDWGATSLENIGYHGVEEAQVPWAEMLLGYLHRLLDRLHYPSEEPNVARLRGFNPDLPRNEPYRITVTVHLCLGCGHQVLTPRKLDEAIAEDVVPGIIVDAYEQGTLSTLVDRVLAQDIAGVPAMRSALREAAAAAGIHVSNGGPRNSVDRRTLHVTRLKCDRCGEQEDAVRRWAYVAGDPSTLEPPHP